MKLETDQPYYTHYRVTLPLSHHPVIKAMDKRKAKRYCKRYKRMGIMSFETLVAKHVKPQIELSVTV